MHAFLRNIGFSGVKTEEQLNRLLDTLQEKYMHTAAAFTGAGGERIITIRAEIADHMGICIRGCFFLDGQFHRTHCYPYVYNENTCATDPGMPFESRNGGYYLSFVPDSTGQGDIWFIADNLEDNGDCLNLQTPDFLHGKKVSLAAFADYATVILPVKESTKMPDEPIEPEALFNAVTADFRRLMLATKRMESEDVYTIIEGCFIPRGVENTDYEITGEILGFKETENTMTGEKMYLFHVGYKQYDIAVAINADDVLGEPMVGRRLKCSVWLIGRIYGE